MKNFIVIHIGPLMKCPPALSVISGLVDLGYETTVITTRDNDVEEYELAIPKGVNLRFIDYNYDAIKSPIIKLAILRRLRASIWDIVDDIYKHDSVLWIITDISLKALGTRILNYRYVLHMLELSEEIRFYKKMKYPKLDTEKFGNTALAVVTPERNRSYITQAYWNLAQLPYVLPNKLYTSESVPSRPIAPLDEGLVEQMVNRKLVLYQGVINLIERPLTPYLEAVKSLGQDFVFGVMASNDPFSNLPSDSSYIYIPYMTPPQHLEVTKRAYIGALSYFPLRDNRYSQLNAVYCAPNKIFEFSKFGKPMIGNNVPGLSTIIETYGCGRILKSFSREDIARCIIEIDENYSSASQSAKEFYNSVDYIKILEEIVGSF